MGVHDRLREERKRLGLTLAQMAQIGGSNARSYSYYESGERAADTEFMSAIAAAGADIQYILTGIPGTPAMRVEEARAGYQVRVVSPAEAAALDALRASGALQSVSQTISGNANQVVGINNGEVNGDKKQNAPGGKRRR